MKFCIIFALYLIAATNFTRGSILRLMTSKPTSQSSIIDGYSKNIYEHSLPRQYLEFEKPIADNSKTNHRESKNASQQKLDFLNPITDEFLGNLINESLQKTQTQLKSSILSNPTNFKKNTWKKWPALSLQPDDLDNKDLQDSENQLFSMISENKDRRLKEIAKVHLFKNNQKLKKKSILKKKRHLFTRKLHQKSKRKLASVQELFNQNFVPEKVGLWSILGGLGVKGVRTYMHHNRLRKLNILAKNQSELNQHTKANEFLLSQIANELKSTNGKLENMKTIADERLASKIDQLRLY